MKLTLPGSKLADMKKTHLNSPGGVGVDDSEWSKTWQNACREFRNIQHHWGIFCPPKKNKRRRFWNSGLARRDGFPRGRCVLWGLFFPLLISYWEKGLERWERDDGGKGGEEKIKYRKWHGAFQSPDIVSPLGLRCGKNVQVGRGGQTRSRYA